MIDISDRGDLMTEQNLIRGKAFDNSAPLGPVLATPDEVPDDTSIKLQLNGEVKQHSSRDDFNFNIPELVQDISGFMILDQGDIISSRTPAVVGPLPDGDIISNLVEGIFTFNHSVHIPLTLITTLFR